MYREDEARRLVIEAGLKLVENKLIARTWGNISARISDEEFVITPSGRGYDTLKLEDLVVIRIADCSYDGDIKPSSEKKIHAAAYALRPDCNFIIHTHQFFASAVAAEQLDTGFAPCAAYGLPGTDKLKKNVAKCIEANPGSKSFLLAGHGTLLLGSSYDEAFALAEKLEEECRALFEAKVPSADVQRSATIDISGYATKGAPYVAIQQDPYVNECCFAGITLRSYIDDFAQIAGPEVRVVRNFAPAIIQGLVGRNAVLVKGVGAICTGSTQEDAEAVAMIVSKNCAASCYTRKHKPMGRIDAILQRYIYINKYSKQKDA